MEFHYDISSIYVLEPELVHPLFFSFYFSPFLVEISTSLKILYSFLRRKYINYIHLLNFLLLLSTFPYAVFIHRCNIFQCYTHSIIHSFSLPPPHYPLNHTITIMFSLSLSLCLSIYIWNKCVYVHMYIYILGLASTYEGKRVTFVLLSMTYFTEHGFQFHPFTCKQHNFILYGWITLPCSRASGLFPNLGYCE
jgi:hypothetical protein